MPDDPSLAPDTRLTIVVMGVAGSGKTTVGLLLADALGLRFVDGDALHPPENVAKMSAGIPLTDTDRWPWLDSVGAVLADAAAHPAGLVVACSALRRAYRDRLRAAAAGIRFAFLDASPDEMTRRLALRADHFMPASLVESQFVALELPVDEDDLVVVPEADAPSEGVERIVAFLSGVGKAHGV